MELRRTSANPLLQWNHTAGALTLLLSLVIGCASPGNPRPPTLNLAELVKDLSAQRIGDQVQLHWTTPSRTNDGVALKGALTAELCRQPSPSAPCSPINRLPVRPGPSQAIDPLPPPFTTEPAALLVYRVQIVNPSGRSAGLSQPAYAAAGTAPPPIAQLRASAAREGVTLEWQPQPVSTPDLQSRTELERSIATPASDPAAPTARQNAPLQLTSSEPTQVRLLTGSSLTDAGGTLDRTAQKGESYTYTAQRVRSVQLNQRTLELRSPKSPPTSVLFTDKFPPSPPIGLASVPGGANSQETSIDLSWESNTEADLAGYLVYRQEVDSAGHPLSSATRLTPTPVVGPAFRDLTAAPGHRYSYTVTAVDTAGNESKPGAAVQEVITEQ